MNDISSPRSTSRSLATIGPLPSNHRKLNDPQVAVRIPSLDLRAIHVRQLRFA